MKRIGFIYELIMDKSNIRNAIIESSKHKRGKAAVKEVLSNIDFYIEKVYAILNNQAFTNHYYDQMSIYEKMSGKWRIISRPKYYPDQIVHWAIMIQLEPILRTGMDFYCSASIKGRGGKHLKRLLVNVLKNDVKNTKYIYKYDICHFYESIDQGILISKLERKIKDKKVINLLKTIISYQDHGLCMGAYISQWLANFYLQHHDHYLREDLRVKYMGRYMDDVVVLDSNFRKLTRIDLKVKDFLKDEKLCVHDDSRIWKLSEDKLDFVGLNFFRNGKVSIRKKIWRNVRRCILRIKCHRDKLTIKLKKTFRVLLGIYC